MSRRLTGAALAMLIAGVVANVAPTLTAPNEGLRTRVYRDPVGIRTVCYGETQQIEARTYSPSECGVLLRRRMARDYAPALVRCVPDLADPARQWPYGALLDAAYNAGPAAACRSPMAAHFRAGRWRQGCEAFPGWYETAQGVRLPGLAERRKQERAYCLTGKRPAPAKKAAR